MDDEHGHAGVEVSSLETVAQELRTALGIDSPEDARLVSLSSYPLADKLRWTKERRGRHTQSYELLHHQLLEGIETQQQDILQPAAVYASQSDIEKICVLMKIRFARCCTLWSECDDPWR